MAGERETHGMSMPRKMERGSVSCGWRLFSGNSPGRVGWERVSRHAIGKFRRQTMCWYRRKRKQLLYMEVTRG